MNPELLISNPLRRPQWRLDRALQLIGHRPRPLRPRRCDDHYVRIYYRILLDLAAARGNEERQDEIIRTYPDAYHAHLLHYSAAAEVRQILEARLLTKEPLAVIAKRLATTPEAIQYYEKIFFNVRDRLAATDWISGIVRGSYNPESRGNSAGTDERGYLLRLVAYYGGVLALDAMISGLSTVQPPQREKDVSAWLETGLRQSVLSQATAAASVLMPGQPNVMQLMTLALKIRSETNKDPEALSDLEERVEKFFTSIKFTIKDGSPVTPEFQQRLAESPLEPRANEAIALANGRIPESLELDLARLDVTRLNGLNTESQ
jgi:hypothetical protein